MSKRKTKEKKCNSVGYCCRGKRTLKILIGSELSRRYNKSTFWVDGQIYMNHPDGRGIIKARPFVWSPLWRSDKTILKQQQRGQRIRSQDE